MCSECLYMVVTRSHGLCIQDTLVLGLSTPCLPTHAASADTEWCYNFVARYLSCAFLFNYFYSLVFVYLCIGVCFYDIFFDIFLNRILIFIHEISLSTCSLNFLTMLPHNLQILSAFE